MCFGQNLKCWSPNGTVFPKQKLMMERVGPPGILDASGPSLVLAHGSPSRSRGITPWRASCWKQHETNSLPILTPRRAMLFQSTWCVYHQDMENMQLCGPFLLLPGSYTPNLGPRHSHCVGPSLLIHVLLSHWSRPCVFPFPWVDLWFLICAPVLYF